MTAVTDPEQLIEREGIVPQPRAPQWTVGPITPSGQYVCLKGGDHNSGDEYVTLEILSRSDLDRRDDGEPCVGSSYVIMDLVEQGALLGALSEAMAHANKEADNA